MAGHKTDRTNLAVGMVMVQDGPEVRRSCAHESSAKAARIVSRPSARSRGGYVETGVRPLTVFTKGEAQQCRRSQGHQPHNRGGSMVRVQDGGCIRSSESGRDDSIPSGVFCGGDAVPPGTFHGGDNVPPGTFH
jgi:hypothetical protein